MDYEKKWKSWEDWLGTGIIALSEIEFRPFEEARKFVHKLKLKNQDEWRLYVKSGRKPADIPSYPEGAYIGKRIVHTLKLKSWHEWSEYCKSGSKPSDVPAGPARTYKKEWKGWGDWLGTGTIAYANKEYKFFEDAKEFVHKLQLKSSEEWSEYSKSNRKPSDIPAEPRWQYKDEWKAMSDWLDMKKRNGP